MTTMNYKGVGCGATIIDTSFDERITIDLDVIKHSYQGQTYDIVRISHVREAELEPTDLYLLKGEAEKLRDYLSTIIPVMKGNV